MTPHSFDLARCVAFDVETYAGRWCVGFYGRSPRTGKLAARVIDRDRKALAETLDKIAERGLILTYKLPKASGVLRLRLASAGATDEAGMRLEVTLREAPLPQ